LHSDSALVTAGKLRASFKPVEGIGWTMAKEERKADSKHKREKPTVSDPGGLP
jgi:hypothetical protein